MDTSLRDEVEALTGALDHIQYVEQIIEKHKIEATLAESLKSRLSYLRDRLSDECLYMAVVGEASTGKSTFINALLGAKLLEAKVLTMTTTLPTKIKYGEQLSVELTLKPDDSIENLSKSRLSKVYTFTRASEPISIPELPDISRVSLSSLISSLTTRNELAKYVNDLTLKFPADFLRGGICIVDTPGADATDNKHATITRQAVASADAAVIITPASQIVSETLLDLIRNRLGLAPFIHRSLFLITEMDLIRERERDSVIAGARHRLERGLKDVCKGVQTLPPVLCASAQSVMDELDDEGVFIVRKAEDRRYWQAQFESLKASLYNRLKRQRVLIISESLLRLLSDVLEALEGYMSEQWTQLSAERAALEAAIIPDLRQFSSQQHQDCYHDITAAADEAKVWLNNAVEEESRLTIKEVENGVESASSLKALKAYLEDDLPRIIEQHQQSLQTKLAPYFNQVQAATENISQTVDLRFETAYQRLSSMPQSLSARDGAVRISLAARDIVASGSDSGAFVTASVGQRATGAAVAVVVGAILLPGLGLLIPAILGSIFSGFLGPSLDERKRSLLAEIRPKLTTQFSDVKINVVRSLCQYEQTMTETAADHVDHHVARYSATVQAMRATQQEKVSQLRSLQAALDGDRQAITRRRNRINLQQRKICSVESGAVVASAQSVSA